MLDLLRRRSLGAVVLAGTLAVAACGGSASPTLAPTPTPASSEAATPTPEPTPEATPTPAASVEPSATPSASLDLTDLTDKVSKFSAYKTTLSITGMATGDIAITTTHQTVPVKAEELEVTAAGQQIGIISIEGKGTWMKTGTAAWAEVDAATAAQMTSSFSAFAPDILLQSFNLDQVTGALDQVGVETKNGVLANHLRVDAAKLAALPDASAIPSDLKMDIWIAQSGDYVVALEFSATVDASGTATPISMKLDVSNVNDAGLKVNPPK